MWAYLVGAIIFILALALLFWVFKGWKSSKKSKKGKGEGGRKSNPLKHLKGK